jgi:hypothetical protein
MFLGGRTNAVRLYHEAGADEEICYYDITSLYPFICKYGVFPLGHPRLITKDFQDVSKYFGLIKAKVLPPRELYHPVLPVRLEAKLVFPLCATCAKYSLTSACTHTDEERAIVGSWVTLEVEKAVEKGYKVLEIYEVWQYDEVATFQKNPLFSDYINCFLKLKTQSSGWPKWVKTEEDKERYIADFERREGVVLDPDMMIYNEGLRVLAKLMLNS